MFRYFKTVLCFALVLVTALLVPTQAIAAANNGKYVSEVYVAYGKNAEEAKKTLEDKGFTPVEGNLNDGGKTYSMLGYKTTNDIRDSITDLSVMNMRGGFSVEDYKTLLKKQKTQIAEFLEEFMTVIHEFRVNLRAEKFKAVYAYVFLNCYIDDDTGLPIGSLLLEETLQDKVGVAKSIEAENPDNLPDLVTILMQGNAQVIKSIESILTIATDTANNSWLDRFAEMDYDTLLDNLEDERPDLNTETKRVQYLDNTYGEEAAVLGLEFADLSNRLNEYAESELQITTATDEDIENAFGDIENDVEANARYQKWMTIGSTYEGLKAFEGGNFAKGELLDFFLDDIDPDDEEIFIPMAASLSDGQRCGLPFTTLDQLLKYAFTNEEGWNTIANHITWKEFSEEHRAEWENMGTVSVYQNIDRDLYKDDGSVALTDAAQRADNTAEGTTGSEEEQIDTLGKIMFVSWAATALCGVATLGSLAVKHHFIKAYETIIEYDWDAWDPRYIYDNQAYHELLEEQPDFKFLSEFNRARYSVILSRALMVATLAFAVISTVLTIIDLCRDESIEQLPIPKYLVDNYTDTEGGSYTLNYKAVECNRLEYFGADYTKQKGSCADLLADDGKQWLALYVSKNSKAGKPLTPDFAVQETSTAPNGYEGSLHIIGEKGAVNVVSGVFKNYSTFSQTWQTVAGDYTRYVFYKLSSDVKTYDEASGNMTASAFSGGTAALFGFGGAAVGAILGALVTVLVKKKKKADS